MVKGKRTIRVYVLVVACLALATWGVAQFVEVWHGSKLRAAATDTAFLIGVYTREFGARPETQADLGILPKVHTECCRIDPGVRVRWRFVDETIVFTVTDADGRSRQVMRAVEAPRPRSWLARDADHAAILVNRYMLRFGEIPGSVSDLARLPNSDRTAFPIRDGTDLVIVAYRETGPEPPQDKVDLTVTHRGSEAELRSLWRLNQNLSVPWNRPRIVAP